MNTEIIIAIICAVFASSGLWGLLQYLINRKDRTNEKLDRLTVMGTGVGVSGSNNIVVTKVC